MQRHRALNLFLHDVYHDQQILGRASSRPTWSSAPGNFRREIIGVAVPGGIYIHVGGTDLIRDLDGRYLVLEDNRRTPSGVSYVLENREAIEADLPAPVRAVRRPAGRGLPAAPARDAPHVAPARGDEPTVVLLTPGVYNSAYFEHSFLARQMGIELVEGRDLVVDRDRVFMRTTRGLRARRRDLPPDRRRLPRPLTFRADSLLGVAGLSAPTARATSRWPTRSARGSPTTRRSIPTSPT